MNERFEARCMVPRKIGQQYQEAFCRSWQDVQICPLGSDVLMIVMSLMAGFAEVLASFAAWDKKTSKSPVANIIEAATVQPFASAQ